MEKRSNKNDKARPIGKKMKPGSAARKRNTPSSDAIVLTPGGWRPKERVHILEAGHHISGKEGRIRVIETVTGKLIKDLGPVSKKPFFRFHNG
jgi:hypothetical protein